ncbi:endolytic transglycosylase MltG [Methylophilus sp.]|uniref:endolytic transglycosylase MltG n=1 Tax=unclassified Methylophilus TaxID=2630143 RepID=UPI000670FD55|nr:endolytic transglycosylase MltG [Methylophilus sp.]AKR43449.1 aminodeoxychorismate lyase [Methylophilus sp. TWE2]PPD10969.1 MAG: endolytic transglycosylase MltG [Methylophilus sp.]
MWFIKQGMKYGAALLGLGGLALGIWMVIFMIRPLPMASETIGLQIPAGASVRGIADQLVAAGVLTEPYSFLLMVKLTGSGNKLQAGDYALNTPLQVLSLLDILKHGTFDQFKLQLTEGKTFTDFRQKLAQMPGIRHDTVMLSDHELMQLVSGQDQHPEGWFFPDTYFLDAQSSDVDLYKRAYQKMVQHLTAAWEGREAGLPYRSMYEALVMASIVEKETGVEEERPQIAGVFVNRLRKGMRLQTDPTVIYGMGTRYRGNITKKDLLTDTPYNTYTRSGLPPTPIALPGLASIQAALHPAKTNALYFVANGQGRHVFTSSLEAHNQAVRAYQLKKH